MLDQLLALVASEEFDGGGFLRIANIAFEAESCQISLLAHLDSLATPQAWRIAVDGIREISGLEGIVYDASLIEDPRHPAILQYIDEDVGLSFARAPRSASEVIGDLLLAHRQTTQDFIGFERYLNRNVALESLIAGGRGRLASGPRFLMDCYAAILLAHEMMPTLIPTRPDIDLKTQLPLQRVSLQMLRLGGAFIVAERFLAQLA